MEQGWDPHGADWGCTQGSLLTPVSSQVKSKQQESNDGGSKAAAAALGESGMSSLCSASGVNCLEFPLGFLAVGIGAHLMLSGGFFSSVGSREGELWAVLALQSLRCWGLQDLAQSRANPAQTSQEQILSKPALEGGSRNLENQTAQGVMEQEKGFL